ncbi:BAI1-associated protein 3 [Collichthys lucidus]|uniref:BAI1-associated protein 3 n=1 Tax=Collichthys lucidus TaxID=240159 RepID=A0A4U5VVV2_COLLU|nr:BAI1-associated protein 3 [Collichthys lucidus]
MTTLLDLKSSVLRQVQRSQSLRSRREPPPTASSPLTHCPDPLPRSGTLINSPSMAAISPYQYLMGLPSTPPPWVSEESMEFFERVNAILQKQENMLRAAQAERASFSLRVSVMKAKNLMAKDANGYSDPYCMLGILVGQSPREMEEKKERKFSFRKRKEKLEKRSSTKEVLPAKCIQVTEVKPETLNPVWDEHFVLDHDDDVSVAEACKKLNEVSGLRGMGSRWQCYSSHHRTQRVCYSLLLRLLRTIDAEWDPATVRGDLERQLSDSFRLYTEHCLCLMKNMRQIFPCTSAAAITRYELMLRGVGYMQNMRAFKTVCPLRNELHLDITTAVKKGSAEWYESLIARYKPEEGDVVHHPLTMQTLEEQLKKLVHVVDGVCADMQRARNIYNQLFYSAVKVDFFSISYRQLEKQVADDVNVAMERVCGTLEQESSRLTQTMGETIFELFMSLKILKGFREFLPLKDAKMLALTVFHNWFKSSIHKWLQIIHDRSCDRIRIAVETDKLEPVHQAKHSSSAVEVTACLSQVREIWLQLAWPDSAGAFIFITRLTDNFCSEAVCYSEMITRKIERNQLGRDHKSFTVQLCVGLNNTEHVRVFLGHLPRDLDWQGVERAMEESCGVEGKEQVYKALNGQLFNMDLDLQREAKRLITLLTDKMLPELRRYIQHISLSPDSINNDDAVSPLMKYLQDTMVILTENLVKENLTRVLQSMWELLLRMILDAVAENRGVQVEFYNRFQYTVETLLQFFHVKGEGLTLEDMKSGEYKVLDEELRLNKCSSFELIEQYYLEKISQQKTLKHTRYGRISVKCYYDAPEQRLTVEILHAADIIALDANGLSDPFVIVELCPHHLFPMAKSQRTQVKLKTLHPVFDELFYFHVSPEQYRHRFACLTFTVMDYDWLSTNDFAGEAVAPLSDFCWPGRPNATPAGKSVQPFILHLSRSKPSEKPIMRMLDARIGDREAQEFVRRLKEIEKSMEEE